jgi:hypothetical protein
MRLRQAPRLAAPALRVSPGALASAVAAALLVLWIVRWAPASAPPVVRWPGWAAAALAIPLVALLDDPARALAGASPTPLPWRRGVRLAVGLVFAGVAWLCVVALARDDASSLQAAALVSVALGTSAVLIRRGRGGRAGTIAPLVLVLAVELFEVPWAAALLAGVGALLWASRPE